MKKVDRMQDQQAALHPISERVAEINIQIREIADQNLAFRAKAVRTQLDHSANQMRELRLLQIREELQQMLKNPV